jgi:GNAT superfamily N-acetyltransferase
MTAQYKSTQPTIKPVTDTAANRGEVERVVMACAEYNWLIEGNAPSPQAVEDFFASYPPGLSLACKHNLGLYLGDELVGIADLAHGWNAPHKLHIGLLMIEPSARRHGLGRLAMAHIERLALSLNATALRIAVIANNAQAFEFWEAMGFVRNGEVKKNVAVFVDDVIILEKPLLHATNSTMKASHDL